jgi:Spy/CpxP family protein refolding chaperone
MKALVTILIILLMALSRPVLSDNQKNLPFGDLVQSILGLSEEQKQQANAIVAEHQEELHSLLIASNEAQKEVKSALLAEIPQEITIRKAARKLAAIQEESLVVHGAIARSLRRILTVEQREKERRMIESSPLLGSLPQGN